MLPIHRLTSCLSRCVKARDEGSFLVRGGEGVRHKDILERLALSVISRDRLAKLLVKSLLVVWEILFE